MNESKAMTIPSVFQRVESFLRNAKPNAYCAPCLTKSLGLAQWYGDEAEATATTAMSSLPNGEFMRATAECSRCGLVRAVVWAMGRTRGV